MISMLSQKTFPISNLRTERARTICSTTWSRSESVRRPSARSLQTKAFVNRSWRTALSAPSSNLRACTTNISATNAPLRSAYSLLCQRRTKDFWRKGRSEILSTEMLGSEIQQTTYMAAIAIANLASTPGFENQIVESGVLLELSKFGSIIHLLCQNLPDYCSTCPVRMTRSVPASTKSQTLSSCLQTARAPWCADFA